MQVPQKVAQRLQTSLKRFQPIVSSAKARDVNESDTVMIVTDMLSELLGWDKYSEVTSEHAIRGTYCDLALSIDGALQAILEVKSVGTSFRESHLRQAVDYAANQGLDWVILTNAAEWRVYQVQFAKPIGFSEVTALDIPDMNPREVAHIEQLYLLTREGFAKSALSEYRTHHLATSRYLIAAALLEEPVLQCLRRELRRSNPDVRVDVDEIREKLLQGVLKRDVVEGEDAEAAFRALAKSRKQALRASRSRADECCEVDAGEATEKTKDEATDEAEAVE